MEVSNDYKVRFVAEYQMLNKRICSLKKMIKSYQNMNWSNNGLS